MKAKMQVASHRVTNGTTYVRLDPIEDASIPAAERVAFNPGSIELAVPSGHALLADLHEPAAEVNEVVSMSAHDAQGRPTTVTSIIQKSPPGAGRAVSVEITPL